MPEYFDVYDEDGKQTGEKVERGEVHRRGLWHQVVHVWLINPKGELLIQKRAASKESFPGMWDISAAGHINAGESARETAFRETEEELGILVPDDKLEHLFSTKQQHVLNAGKYINNEIVEVYLVETEIDTASMKLQVEEVEAVRLIPWKDLKKRLEEQDAEFVPMPASSISRYSKFFDTLQERYP